MPPAFVHPYVLIALGTAIAYYAYAVCVLGYILSFAPVRTAGHSFLSLEPICLHLG